ncbi:hypothetical protein BDR07DRAFT_187149 [Suillus spraguei]|nr:hypothetical protein BDR07DRAFT_784379 [Suillus spraguei]KAG2359888.1 hypothetical protein BDR07DRAFT_187149 [Suillus spraguei]
MIPFTIPNCVHISIYVLFLFQSNLLSHLVSDLLTYRLPRLVPSFAYCSACCNAIITLPTTQIIAGIACSV